MQGVEIVAEAANGKEAVDLVGTFHPDVVLLDIGMKVLNGIEAAVIIARDYPLVRVIILSVHDTQEFVAQALKAGASGYVLKDAAPVELEFALQAVTNGETYLSPRISRQVVQSLVRPADVEAGLEVLSPRQREILKAVAGGRSTKQIAYDLGLSVKTIETHRAQVMERLGIHDVAGLVRYSIRIGLIIA
jgi:DNA-binding NarL/FixJ family response regulator